MSPKPAQMAGPAAADALLSRLGIVAGALETATDRGDIENIHRLRTSLRRLRAVMRAYKAVFPTPAWQALRGEVAELFRATSTLRDIDVQTERLRALEVDVPPAVLSGLERILLEYRDAEKPAAIAVEDAVVVLTRHGSLRAIGEWALWARGGPTPLDPRLSGTEIDARRRRRSASRLARRRLVKDMERLHHDLTSYTHLEGDGFSDMSPEELHATRIAAKKLRYLSEAFDPVLPSAGLRKRARVLGRIQDLLGEIHDADVASAHLLPRLELNDAVEGDGPGFAYLLGDARARREASLVALRREWPVGRLRSWLEDWRAALG